LAESAGAESGFNGVPHGAVENVGSNGRVGGAPRLARDEHETRAGGRGAARAQRDKTRRRGAGGGGGRGWVGGFSDNSAVCAERADGGRSAERKLPDLVCDGSTTLCPRSGGWVLSKVFGGRPGLWPVP